MKTPLQEMYKGVFFGKRHRMLWRVPIVCEAIAEVIEFNSVIDIGCAIGDIVKGFEDLGKLSHGLEGSINAKPFLLTNNVTFKDLRSPLEIPMKFDLCTCLEVAEHIETEYIGIFIKNITSLSDKILVSIAKPRQEGHRHFTLKPIEWWDNAFSLEGFIRDDRISTKIKLIWENYPEHRKKGIVAYYNNLHYYAKSKRKHISNRLAKR